MNATVRIGPEQSVELPILTRRVGSGPVKLFCVQGGPGGMFWDLDFLAVYLDLSKYEVIQYDPPGSPPSSCWSEQGCGLDPRWMSLETFVSVMEQVWSRAFDSDGGSPAPERADDASKVIVGHSFGVVVALEFLLKHPSRRREVRGAVLADWVAAQSLAARRDSRCDSEHWAHCRMYRTSRETPWRALYGGGVTNRLLGRMTWGPYGNGTGGFLQDWDVRPQLAEISDAGALPALCFAGDSDIVFPDDVKAMCRGLGGAFVLLEDAGHFSFMDQRAKWLHSFEQWLGQSVLGGTSAARGAGESLALRSALPSASAEAEITIIGFLGLVAMLFSAVTGLLRRSQLRSRGGERVSPLLGDATAANAEP